MRVPDRSPILDEKSAPMAMGPETLSNAGAGVWRKAPVAFPDSRSVLDKFCLRAYTRNITNASLDWLVCRNSRCNQ